MVGCRAAEGAPVAVCASVGFRVYPHQHFAEAGADLDFKFIRIDAGVLGPNHFHGRVEDGVILVHRFHEPLNHVGYFLAQIRIDLYLACWQPHSE